MGVKFHSGKVVQGVCAALDEGEDPVQPPLSAGDLQRGARD